MDTQASDEEKKKAREEVMAKLQLIPDPVYAALFTEAGTQANEEIGAQYGLSDEQMGRLLDLNLAVTFKEVPIEQLPGELTARLGADEATARQIALDLLTKKFNLARSYFPGLTDAILALGGQVPPEVPMPSADQFLVREEGIEALQAEEAAAEEEAAQDTPVTDFLEVLMERYPEAGQMTIGDHAITVKGMDVEMQPMIKYWVQDYMEKTGYYRHDNLDRLQYVCHDKNTRSMNDEERRQLNLVFKSVDKEIKLPYSLRRQKIDFSLVEEE